MDIGGWIEEGGWVSEPHDVGIMPSTKRYGESDNRDINMETRTILPLWVILTRVTKFIKISSLLENGERKTEGKRGSDKKRKIQRVREKGGKREGIE